MQVDEEPMKRIVRKMRVSIAEHIDRTKGFKDQTNSAVDRYMEECGKMKVLARYPDCWPALVYLKLYLASGITTRFKQREAKARVRVRETRRRKATTPECCEESDERELSPEIPLLVINARPRKAEPEGPVTRFLSSLDVPDNSAPVAGARRCEAHEDPLALAHFLRSLEPPQDALLEPLQRAGVRDAGLLELLKRNEVVREQLLVLLVQTGVITLLQRAILFDGLQR